MVNALHQTKATVIILRGPNFSANIPEGTCINAYPREKNDANKPNCVLVNPKSFIIGTAI